MTVLLNGTDIRTTRLGFGLSKLMRVPHRIDRLRLLEVAFDHGIRHFDVARMYGLGAAEEELGDFLGSRRGQVVLATKFGIEPQGATGYLSRVQSPVRWLFRKFPKLRDAAARSSARLSRPKRFTPDYARRSLETSLRALRSDYVDILFLHEPTGHDTISSDLQGCLEDLKVEGKIRAFGISSMAYDVKPVIRKHRELASVLQFDNDLYSRQIETLDLPCDSSILTFAPFSAALPALKDTCSRQPACVEAVLAETGIDLRRRDHQNRVLIGYALHSNPRGTVIFASTKIAHIAEIATCVAQSLPEEHHIRVVIEKLTIPTTNTVVPVGRS